MFRFINTELFSQTIPPDQVVLPVAPVGDSQISSILQIVFGVFAAVAVLVIAISALRIVISRGNSQDIGKARDTIIYAAIGLAVSMMAFVIVRFVLGSI